MKRILIADDDKKIARALSIRLNQAGYETVVAQDGPTAIRLATENQPDLILMDIWMPGMGLKVATQLTQMGIETPVIFLTASKKTSLWARAQRIGSAGFFEKPYDSEKLMRTIKRNLAPSPAIAADTGPEASATND